MNNNLQPINTIPNFKRFCMTIGELPTSYLETMTYYEMLVWFTEYMKNTIIPTINNNGLAVEELQNKYNELKSYVDNYFTNLDVQQEINNKLDEMVETGQLQEIISNYLNSKAVFGFDNVQAMKEATNLINGSYAKTLGYYNINDGGMATYKIREITNDDIVDERLILSLNNNLIAEIIIKNNTINALEIGIKNDKSSNSDISVLNNYISQYNIYIPSGEYILNNNIEITREKTYFTCDGTINIDSLHSIILKAVGCTININEIKNGEFNGTGFILSNQNNLSSTYNNINIKQIFKTNIGFLCLGTGLKGIQYNKINFNLIHANTGIKIILDSINAWVNENTFNGGRIMGTLGIKVEKINGQLNLYDGNKFYNIGFEELEKIGEFEKTTHFLFTGLRTQEQITGDTWLSFDSESNSNKFESLFHLYINKITDNNSSGNKPNIYYAKSITFSNSGFLSDKLKFINGKPFIYNRPYYRYPIKSYYGEGDLNVNEDIYYKDMMISCGCDSNKTLNIVLNDIFDDNGVDSFILRVSFIGTNSTINIKDSSGNVIYTKTTTESSESNKYIKFTKNYYLNNNNLNPLWLSNDMN